jgi:hypothetical protein
MEHREHATADILKSQIAKAMTGCAQAPNNLRHHRVEYCRVMALKLFEALIANFSQVAMGPRANPRAARGCLTK